MHKDESGFEALLFWNATAILFRTNSATFGPREILWIFRPLQKKIALIFTASQAHDKIE